MLTIYNMWREVNYDPSHHITRNSGHICIHSVNIVKENDTHSYSYG